MGIWIGVYLSTRTQKRQWIRDNKRLEYRELLTAIADAAGKLVLYYGRNPVVLSAAEQMDMWEIKRTTLGVIYNRLFVAKEIKELRIQERLQYAITALTNKRDAIWSGTSMDSIMEDIRTKALKEFS